MIASIMCIDSVDKPVDSVDNVDIFPINAHEIDYSGFFKLIYKNIGCLVSENSILLFFRCLPKFIGNTIYSMVD